MRIFVLCGEPSGDLYGWLLLKDLDHDVIGVGGERLSSILKEKFVKPSDFNILGIMPAQMIKTSSRLKRLKTLILDSKPDLFMPVSYPGLNLPLSNMFKRRGVKVCYLLPPQIWAWGRFRKRFLQSLDLVISVFPFEKKYLNGIKTIYIGNPLIDFLKRYRDINPIPDLIGLLPGSRPKIVERHIGFLIKLASRLKDRYRFRIFLKDAVDGLPDYIEVYKGDHYNGMRECSKVIVKLGTASLEAAILGIPQIAFFIPSKTDYILKPFIRTNEFSIVNKILGRKTIRYYIAPDIETMISSLEKINEQDLFPELKKLLKFDREKLAEIGFG